MTVSLQGLHLHSSAQNIQGLLPLPQKNPTFSACTNFSMFLKNTYQSWGVNQFILQEFNGFKIEGGIPARNLTRLKGNWGKVEAYHILNKNQSWWLFKNYNIRYSIPLLKVRGNEGQDSKSHGSIRFVQK